MSFCRTIGCFFAGRTRVDAITDVRAVGPTDRRIDERTDGRIYFHIVKMEERSIAGKSEKMAGKTDGRMDGLINGRTEGRWARTDDMNIRTK